VKILITGSSGHLGEALIRSLEGSDHEAVGLDIKASPFTDKVGSVADRDFVRECVSEADAIIHSATLHKPHVSTHTRQDFIDTNVTGTLNLLEEAVVQDIQSFIFTSTTSTFGNAMKPAPGEPAVWVTEDLRPQPKNIYGITKLAAESLCELFHQNTELPCLILKTSRFFPEEDDDKARRGAFSDENLKVNELLFRRADVADMVQAHVLALEKAPAIGFDKFIISATTPFSRDDAKALGTNAAEVVEQYYPGVLDDYADRNWQMFETIGRVYDNTKARQLLDFEPEHNFDQVLARLAKGEDPRSDLALAIGAKGYHDTVFDDGPYPVDRF